MKIYHKIYVPGEIHPGLARNSDFFSDCYKCLWNSELRRRLLSRPVPDYARKSQKKKMERLGRKEKEGGLTRIRARPPLQVFRSCLKFFQKFFVTPFRHVSAVFIVK